MIRRAAGILLLDPSGELLKTASREMRLRREAAYFATTEDEALAWRRRHGAVAVVVAPADRAAAALRAAAGRPAPVLVTYGKGPAVRGAFRVLGASPAAEALASAVDDALAVARMRRANRCATMMLRRRERQLRSLRAQAEGNADRLRRLADANVRLQEIASGLLRLTATVAEGCDPDLPSRAERTARVATALGRRMGLSQHELDDLRVASLLHDVARAFPAWQDDASAVAGQGARILEPLPFSQAVIDGVRWHRERWDGRGNLSGLSGDEIPRAARILALAVAFVELARGDGSTRGLGAERAAQAMKAEAGRAHDPEAVKALCRLAGDDDEMHRLGFGARELTGATR